MKITGILVLVAVMSLAGVFSEERICGTQPLRTEDWSYDVDTKRESGTRIVNGTDSHVGEWPWQVMLVMTNPEGDIFLCGGSLITENHVLTAAHCADGPNWKVRIVLGAHAMKNTEETHRVVRKVLRRVSHENFHSEPEAINDVQIMFLDSPVEFTDYIRPICFPKPDEDFSEKTAWVTGWGQTDGSDELSIPDVLQKVAAPIWKYSKCDAFNGTSQEAAGKLCTGYDDGGNGACMGDSGGPLVIQRPDGHWTLVGVTSHGITGCAKPKEPAVFMRVTHYRDWIEKQINTTLFDD